MTPEVQVLGGRFYRLSLGAAGICLDQSMGVVCALGVGRVCFPAGSRDGCTGVVPAVCAGLEHIVGQALSHGRVLVAHERLKNRRSPRSPRWIPQQAFCLGRSSRHPQVVPVGAGHVPPTPRSSSGVGGAVAAQSLPALARNTTHFCGQMLRNQSEIGF